MVSTNRQTDLPIDLKSAGGRQEAEVGGLERVGGGQADAAMVDACGVGRLGRAAQCEVPFEKVGVEGGGGEVGRGVSGEFRGFFYCGKLVKQGTQG